MLKRPPTARGVFWLIAGPERRTPCLAPLHVDDPVSNVRSVSPGAERGRTGSP